LGFEFGYSWESPRTLNLWEAQFGDFNNGAQIIIDTYVSSSETKWLRASGLIMLLPHGYDGAGPEHSSSRLERFLQICDGDPFSIKPSPVNLIVANVSSPANYFHLLRRQMLRPYRRPLVLAAPKTLLRHTAALSRLGQMGPSTHFMPVMSDSLPTQRVKTIALVSGKLFYDLESARTSRQRNDIAFIRLEELSPFPFERLAQEFKKYTGKIDRLIWCQEEPMNAGAWWFVQPRVSTLLKHLSQTNLPSQMEYVGRPALPLPAIGSTVVHKSQEDSLTKSVFGE